MHNIYMRIRFSFFHSQYKEISLSYSFNSNWQYSRSTKLQWTCHLQTQYANDIIADIKLSLIPCYFCLCLFLLLCLLCLLLLILFLLISRRALLLLADLESPGLWHQCRKLKGKNFCLPEELQNMNACLKDPF